MEVERRYPTLEVLLGHQDTALVEVKTIHQGWDFIEKAASENGGKASFEGICHVIFRQLVGCVLRAHDQKELAAHMENPRIHHKEAFRSLENITKKAGNRDPLSVSIKELLEAFSEKKIRERLLATSTKIASRPHRSARPQQQVRPGPNRMRASSFLRA